MALHQLLRPDDPWAWMALEVTAKATLLLFRAAILALLLVRFSAALRHRLWAMVFVGLLMLPLASVWLPGLGLPIIPREMAAWHRVDRTAAPASQMPRPSEPAESFPADPRPPVHDEPTGIAMTDPKPRRTICPRPQRASAEPAVQPIDPRSPFTAARCALRWGMVAAGLADRHGRRCWCRWSAGFSGILDDSPGRLVVDSQLRRLLDRLRSDLGFPTPGDAVATAQGTNADDLRLCAVVRGTARRMLRWTDERLRVVLLHEPAHIKRRDVFWQLVARVACACTGFIRSSGGPLRRIADRENACDHCVLAAGQKASRYATHLLEIARLHQSCSTAGIRGHVDAAVHNWKGDCWPCSTPGGRDPARSARAATLLFSTVLAVLLLGALGSRSRPSPCPRRKTRW